MKLLSVLTLLGAGLLAGWAGSTTEAAVIPMSVADLTVGSDLVVRGTVVDKVCRWTSDGHMIETFFTISRSETLKGAGPAVITVRVPGGDLDGIAIRNGEAPTFVVGEEVVFFGKRQPAGADGLETYETYGWFQGKFTLLDGMVRELVTTHYDALRTQILAHVGR